MKKLVLSLAVICPLFSFAQYQIKGKVIDKNTNEALTGATILIENSYNATFSDIDGSFKLNKLKNDKVNLIVSFIGYETDTVSANLSSNNEISIALTQKVYQSEEVIISSTRVNDNAPATATNISKQEIEDNNLGQDLPFLLQQSPSVVSTSDAGAGIGYTGVRIRGSDASRINVTINGIPLNDAESHGVFWVNMPDFASSLNSVQIQRGVGTSTNGAASFGATINLETTTLNQEEYAEVNNSFGSFNSRKHTVKFGSGLIDNKFAFEGRLSNIQSDGYVDRASADLRSYFLSGSYFGKNTVIKGITFGGKEVTFQSWNGVPEARLNGSDQDLLDHYNRNLGSIYKTRSDSVNLFQSDRTYNLYTYDNQVDNYNQDHYQLHISHEFSSKLTANFSLHYTIGRGYFEQFRTNDDLKDYDLNDVIISGDTITTTDLIRRRWLDNDFYGFTYSVLYNPTNKLNFVLGGGLNNYKGDHFGEVIWAEFASNGFPTDNYYFNDAEKLDGNTYLKTTYQVNSKLSILADLQYRFIEYSAKGTDNDLRQLDVEEDFNFFNPKIGINYELNENTTLYSFMGIGNREPNRADFVDQPLNTPKSEANEAETMRNVELGGEYRADQYKLSVNLFLMDYDNQLVSTGQLNDVGSPLRQNVDKSYRRGIEIQGIYNLTKKLNFMVNATFSENKIESYEELTYDYTVDFDIISDKKSNTDIALSPGIILNSQLSYKPIKELEVALLSRYVGEQFLDNTSDKSKMLDAYLVNDVRIQYAIPTKLLKEAKLQLLVNNIFSEEYSSNGYTYSYIVGNTITENFFFPQALRNYMLGLNLKF